jgi:hypothetical protein
LCCLWQLHNAGVILLSLCPENIVVNPSDGSATISTFLDAQSNAFLPPEFFHVRPSEFDVWQFGVFLLSAITAFHPVSHGADLRRRAYASPARGRPPTGCTDARSSVRRQRDESFLSGVKGTFAVDPRPRETSVAAAPEHETAL